MLIDEPDIRAIHAESTRVRAKVGLQPQTLDESLCQKAQAWADHMAQTGRFEHGGGEQIIAHDTRQDADPDSCITSWLGSSRHRPWVLGHSTKVGWGIASSDTGTYWAGAFNTLNPGGNGGGSGGEPAVVIPAWLRFLKRLFGR